MLMVHLAQWLKCAYTTSTKDPRAGIADFYNCIKSSGGSSRGEGGALLSSISVCTVVVVTGYSYYFTISRACAALTISAPHSCPPMLLCICQHFFNCIAAAMTRTCKYAVYTLYHCYTKTSTWQLQMPLITSVGAPTITLVVLEEDTTCLTTIPIIHPTYSNIRSTR